MIRKIVIMGATSRIAEETARFFAEEHAAFFIVGRSREKLEAVSKDLFARGASQVAHATWDVNKDQDHAAIISRALEFLGNIDIALVAPGTTPDQIKCEEDSEIAVREIKTNFLSLVPLLLMFAGIMEKQKCGCLAVITSVAGDRGRRSNYIYGSAKSGLSTFLQGLRARLYSSGVHVLTIKPGPVDTPMTSHLKKTALFADPKTVGYGIYRSILARKDVVYLPWFWRGIMGVIKTIPESLFKKMKLE